MAEAKGNQTRGHRTRKTAKRTAKRRAGGGVAVAAKAAPPPLPGARIAGRLLDARPDRLDFRDLPYRPPLRSLPAQSPKDDAFDRNFRKFVEAGLVLDQGSDGACTGFGLACVANYLLFVRHVEAKARTPFVPVSPRMLYELARRYDEWQGVDYEGSSCRGALKGWHKHGVCSAGLWPYTLDGERKAVFVPPQDGWERDAVTRPLGVYYRVECKSVVDLQAAIHDIGAVYVSANVHDGWDALMHDAPLDVPASVRGLDAIGPARDPKAWGGHAFALVGYEARGFIVQNSWGPSWGHGGFAILRYEDWVENGNDAWVCALGVAVEVSAERTTLARFRVPSGMSLGTRARTARNPANPSDDPWPIDHPYLHAAYQPWTTAQAYAHTLVSGNDGVLEVSDITYGADVDPAPFARAVAVDAPDRWFAQNVPGAVAKVMLYAHGGLNGEDESIRRIRVLAPYVAANGIYPLFLTWRTGPVETLLDVFEDYFRGRPEIGPGPAGGIGDEIREGADRFIEATSHTLLRGIWSEMRGNAEWSAESGRTVDLVAKSLIELRDVLARRGVALEVHLVGHSAGSILHGWLIDRLLRADLAAAKMRISTCTLYAAACSLQFAIGTFGKAAARGTMTLDDLVLHYLSEDNEKDDGLPSAELALYGKSLLCLVSRALDDVRKMPLLGLQGAIDPASFDARDWAAEQLPAVLSWRQLWTPQGPGAAQRGFAVTAPSVRTTREGATIRATHGSIDNSIDALAATLERIRGSPLVAPIEWLDY